MASTEISNAMNELDRAYSEGSSERGMFKIALHCFRVPPALVEKCNTVLQVFHRLTDNDPHTNTRDKHINATCKVVLIAKAIGTGVGTNMGLLTKLVRPHQAVLARLETSLEFLLAQLLIDVCLHVTKFKEFSDRWNARPCGRIEAGGIEEKVQKLLTAGYLSIDKVDGLRDVLDSMGKKDLVKKVDKFVEQRDSATLVDSDHLFPLGVIEESKPVDDVIVCTSLEHDQTPAPQTTETRSTGPAEIQPQVSNQPPPAFSHTPQPARGDSTEVPHEYPVPVTRQESSTDSQYSQSSDQRLIPEVECNDKKRLCEAKQKTCICCIIKGSLILFGVIFLVSGLAMTGYGGYHYSQTLTEIRRHTVDRLEFVHENVTQVLAVVNGDHVSHISVAEDTQSGDYPHTTDLYLLREGGLLRHHQELVHTSPAINQTPPLRTAGQVIQYLLNGSLIYYQFNAAVSGGDNNGWLFVFDDFDHFQSYKNGGDGQSLAWLSRKLNIGPVNMKQPTTLNNIVVTEDGYYIIAAQIPPDIHYDFTYIIHQGYLLYSDYSPQYTVSSYSSADIALPGPGPWYLLGFTRIEFEANSGFSHLRLKTTASDEGLTADVVIMAVGGLLITLSIVIFVLCCCLCCVCKPSSDN